MGLIEDAKRLQAVYGKPADHVWIECGHPTTQQGGEGCHRFMSCHAYRPDGCRLSRQDHHEAGDPLLAMPRIVKALEAAQAFIGIDPILKDEGEQIYVCPWCRSTIYVRNAHGPDCPWQALVAALQDAPE